MGAVLGLGAAVAFGVSDFLAGVGARRLHFLWVTLLGQAVGVLVAGAAASGVGGTWTAPALVWGAVGGLGSAVGTLALYRGYGHGEMAVAGPLSAVGAAALPTLLGVALGERLPWPGVVGVLLALPAIWLMASGGDNSGVSSVRAGVWDGLVSGAGFAFLFVALNRAGSSAGLWPVLADQVVALAVVALAAMVLRPPLPHGEREHRARLVRAPLLAGLLGIAATVLYFFASHTGLLTVAAVLTSVYPGITVALAALVLRERPSRRQRVGLLLGGAAVALIVAA